MSGPLADGEALRFYLRALFGRDPDAVVEIAHQAERDGKKGPMHRGVTGEFARASDLDAVARRIEALAEHEHVWIGVLPRRPNMETGEIGGSREFVAPGRALWTDLDLKDTPDALERLKRFEPAPHMIVASGGGYHAYWLLDHDIADLDALNDANRRLAAALGGDFRSAEPTRILRPPGTLNYKSEYGEPGDVSLLEIADHANLSPAQIVGHLPAPPTKPRAPRDPEGLAKLDAADPLRRIPPPQYLEDLTGATPGRGGFVSCPLPDHNDSDPSCKVWDDPARGWYCFGCDRGGDIYTLAGLLWGLDTRGKQFLELRDRLNELFGLDRDPPTRVRPSRDEDRPPDGAPPAPPAAVATEERALPVAVLDPDPTPPAVDEDAPPPSGSREDRTAPAAADGHANRPPPTVALATAGAQAIGLAASAKLLLLLALAGAAAAAVLLLLFALFGLAPPPSGGRYAASAFAERDIPALYLDLYQSAGQAFGLDWAVLAAIGKVETNHGRSRLPGVRSGVNSYGCCAGPMQFNVTNGPPSTWDAYGRDDSGDGERDVYDPSDAIPAAARLLKANGAPRSYERAVFAYNHAGWYVADVLRYADRYRGAYTDGGNFTDTGGKLAWPVTGPVVSGFGMRWGRLHAGIDIAAPAGRTVHAAGSGEVVIAWPVPGYGNFVCVRHRRRLYTCYAHLSAYRTRRGRHVDTGEVIGHVGCTGHCFGDHLHFEVRTGPPLCCPTDPVPYLGRTP